MSQTTALPPHQLAAIKERRRSSVYGHISGLRLDRRQPAARHGRACHTAVRGVLHGGVITAMVDESCGMAVQLALDSMRSIATLDLRIDYQKPAMAGLDIRAHSICTRVTRSIAFVRCTAYQESQEDPVATAAACFMIGASQTSLLTDWPKDPFPTLDAPDEPAGPFANSPFAVLRNTGQNRLVGTSSTRFLMRSSVRHHVGRVVILTLRTLRHSQRVPTVVSTSTVSPLVLPISARAIGDVTEMFPLWASASGSPTICHTLFSPVSSSISDTVAPNLIVSPESLETSITSARARLVRLPVSK